MKLTFSARKTWSILITTCLFTRLLPVWADCDRAKISFNLSAISDQGLIGKEDGLRAMSYEFCIPATTEALTEVQRLDPTIQYSHSRGRIGCQADQYLCIGSTHQQNWREVLNQLASLDYVQKIDPFWGE